MKKRIISILILLTLIMTLSSCGSKDKLLLLNWGEYINEDVLKNFEKEYNCKVIVSLADSNDTFYYRVRSATTAYDLVVPSDWMVEKMYDKNLLQKIDFTKLSNYESFEDTFLPGCVGIKNEMEEHIQGISDYYVPYFWGTWGLMYNKKCIGLEDSIKKAKSNGNVWDVMFDNSAVPNGTRVGMYDTNRYAYAAAMFYNQLSPNIESDEYIKKAEQTFRQKKFNEWGNDTLKKHIKSNNLDLAFVWTGDFLDMLYTDIDGIDYYVDENTINYNIEIPDDTIAFMDNLVIPKNARHVDLAHKFIDYFLKPENAYQNASIVGYCTPVIEAYNLIVNYESDENNDDDIWLTNWKWAVSTYYPMYVDNEKGFKGVPLANVSDDYIDKINTLCFNARTGN